MSVSDVLEVIIPGGETEAGFYYCDNIGSKACRFDMIPVGNYGKQVKRLKI